MTGIVGYGVYLPYWRIQRSTIGSTLGSGGGKGARSVASYDEDTTSMGVESARLALKAAPSGYEPEVLWFSTSNPAYLDKTNATGIHAALALPDSVGAYDVLGGVRSATGAARAAGSGGAQVAVFSDVRTGLPGGADESAGGDAAATLLFGANDDAIAVPIGTASVSAEFVDRWRTPGDQFSKVWEDRFGEHAYVPVAEEAISRALKSSGLSSGDVDHLIVTGLQARAVGVVRKSFGAQPDAVADDLTGQIGNTGSAHWAVMLADVLDRARPNQVIVVASMSDGCDVWVLRTTDKIVGYGDRRAATVRQQLASTRDDLSYASFLTWRGFLHREPPRRPEPERPAAPPSLRMNTWKYGFYGSRDEGGFLHMPPSRVSMGSGEIDHMEPVRMADVQATIATFTVDRLAYSMSPPVVAVVLDFDGGGRLQCELTDVDPTAVRIGDRVEMTFRRLYTQDGVHNYFWKARPTRGN